MNLSNLSRIFALGAAIVFTAAARADNLYQFSTPDATITLILTFATQTIIAAKRPQRSRD